MPIITGPSELKLKTEKVFGNSTRKAFNRFW